MSATNPIEIPKTYSPNDAHHKWNTRWQEQNAFSSKNVNKDHQRKSFSVIMPPPNVTGRLHMGHALDLVTQDIPCRYYRKKGFDVCWIPGVDHAGIATQAKVEEHLFKQHKLTKHQISREAFLQHIWDWKEQFGSEIVQQIKSMGASCDWNTFTFTLDPAVQDAVRKVFVDWYNQGLIYQGYKIINWDPELQSAVSDAEVIMEEMQSPFYYLKYYFEDSEEYVVVATTRPETVFADVAVAYHPTDKRYQHLMGRKVKIPLTQKFIPFIPDESIEMEKGSGLLKVTPAHSAFDFEIGIRHDLPSPSAIGFDGKLTSLAGEFAGMPAFKSRSVIAKKMRELGYLQSETIIVNMVGVGERSHQVIEPLLGKQWFVKVESLNAKAKKAVEEGKTSFIPKGTENIFFAWMNAPKDWCISRQLVWGHRIPVFTCKACGHQWADIIDPKQCTKCSAPSPVQDPDVLDTWFSSGLWPLVTLGWPNEMLMKEKQFEKYFPQSVLVTGQDIIFFWVARMLMMSLELTQSVPFHQVYIHGIVRDKEGRKMSKSLGNGIDPLDMIEKYGADALRFTLASLSGYSKHINLDPAQIELSRNFVNKVWNAFRFVAVQDVETSDLFKINQLESINSLDRQEKWLLYGLQRLSTELEDCISDYRFDEAAQKVYHFTYDNFCSHFIEFSKNILNAPNNQKKYQRICVLRLGLSHILHFLHPFCPYVTEEIFGHLYPGNSSCLATTHFPDILPPDASIQSEFKKAFEEIENLGAIISVIRAMRGEKKVPPKQQIPLIVSTQDEALIQLISEEKVAIENACMLSGIDFYLPTTEIPPHWETHIFPHFKISIDTTSLSSGKKLTPEELDLKQNKLNIELSKIDEELSLLNKKLQSADFQTKASEAAKEKVAQKEQDLKKRKDLVEQELKILATLPANK